MMGFLLQECTDDDMPRVFELFSTSFGNEHPYIEAVFPAHETTEGRRIGSQRISEWRKADPLATHIKVVDQDTGKMIGYAKWIVCNGTIPPEIALSGDYWETEDQKEYAAHIFTEYLKPRRRAIKDLKGQIICLDLMTVDPEYQRRGAGRMLLKWGVDKAEELQVNAVVEATDPGRGLYESQGFEVQYKYETEMSGRWAGREKQVFWWMIRPLKKQ